MIDYLKIIHKYIPPNTPAYRLYIVHVSLVTKKALHLARRQNLSIEQSQFIEEAGMLHDIGIVKVKEDTLMVNGTLPYICHGPAGRKILEAENLPKHSLVCERHTGVGLTEQDIIDQQLPLPPGDYIAHSIEEELISYADLFFTKVPEYIWQEKTIEEVAKGLEKFGEHKVDLFHQWVQRFEPELL